MPEFPCSSCNNNVNKNHRAILCDSCNMWVHIKRNYLSPKDYELLQQNSNQKYTFPLCILHNK